ncbi:CFDP2 [Symbiodinium natans]|uniref:CFDP2 protein n=1 Tax=Symbiodinium natans TaxID=878477 RepID=A0A812U758_9DINO|nr:CFDP2 [Symbiodinium natans]
MDAEKAMQGVGFLLNQQMQAAWKAADSLCECAGGRLIRIRLKIRGRFFSVIWCYAPTYRCSDEEKDQFYAKLGRLLNEIPARDDLILLGDFNARVGLALEEREEQGPVVREMVGTRGLPERNDNGVRLLDFCSGRVREKLCIASTFYKRREYGTWFHQSSRRWYQIDHVICSRQTKSLVTDVCAMPGYVHETDHRCLRLQFAVPPKAYLGKFYRSGRSARQEVRPPRLLVSGLKVPEVARDFNEQLHSLMVEGFFDEGYELFGYALRKVAHKCLGAVPVEGGPQWKLDNAPKLARTKGGEYKAACKKAKNQVQQLINTWWKEKAAAIQEAVDAKDPNYQFAGYRELRRVLASGRQAPGKLKDAKGNLLHTRSGRIHRWREYFEELLNVPAAVELHQLDKVTELVPDNTLDSVPTFAETVAAVGRLKPGKAAGPDGVAAEVVQALDAVNLRALHEMFARVWMGLEVMLEAWKEAFLVPLPKKGDLTQRKRWRPDPSKSVKIADFGISKRLSGATLARTMVGTLEIMAPERVRALSEGVLAEAAEYGPESDLWSLGVVLYELAVLRLVDIRTSGRTDAIPYLDR